MKPVETLLMKLNPYLRLKKRIAKLVLEIIKEESEVRIRSDFIEVCKKIDKVAELTDSNTRTITAEVVDKECPND